MASEVVQSPSDSQVNATTTLPVVEIKSKTWHIRYMCCERGWGNYYRWYHGETCTHSWKITCNETTSD